MKFRHLFNLIEDAQDIAAVFENVRTPEQMVSALERLKKQGASQFLEDVSSLRLSLEAVLEDALELGGGADTEDEPDSLTDDELADLGAEEEQQTPDTLHSPEEQDLEGKTNSGS